MSREQIVPRRSQAKRNTPQHPITITCTKGETDSRRVFVTVRPDLLKEPPEFWKLGQDVTASWGNGPHAGQMRIEKGGQTKIKSSGARVRVVLFGLRTRRRAADPLGSHDEDAGMSANDTQDPTAAPSRDDVIAALETAHEAAVQRVIDRFQTDVQAMAVEIVRLRGELMVVGEE